MFRKLLTTLLIVATLGLPVFATVRVDHAAHFGLSYFAVDTLSRVGIPKDIAAILVIGAGLYKEYVIDVAPDQGDIVADVSAVFIWTIDI